MLFKLPFEIDTPLSSGLLLCIISFFFLFCWYAFRHNTLRMGDVLGWYFERRFGALGPERARRWGKGLLLGMFVLFGSMSAFGFVVASGIIENGDSPAIGRMHLDVPPKAEENEMLSGKTQEELFWSWFKKYEPMLFKMDDESPGPVLDVVKTALARVDLGLAFEISRVEDGKREFVISAEGVKELFPAVERLAAAAPDLPRWTVRKYRPRTWPLPVLCVGDAKIHANRVEVALFPIDGEIGICLFMPGLPDREHRMRAGFLLLDAALGEFDVATKVGPIEFLAFEDHPDAPRFPLTELPKRFDEIYALRN